MIFEDLQLVINWATGKYHIQNIQLAQILFEVHRLADLFETVHFMYIYQERNSRADLLAKDGSNVLNGSWQISEHRAAKCSNIVMLY